jgi:hypothetical protein
LLVALGKLLRLALRAIATTAFNSVFEIVRVVGRGLVSIAEVPRSWFVVIA